jgi:hypothetical protein
MAYRILTLALATGTAIGMTTLAHAQGGVGGSPSSPGAMGYTPGWSDTYQYQPPGRIGPPPGRIMNERQPGGTTGQGARDAFGYAPGPSANPPLRQGRKRPAR